MKCKCEKCQTVWTATIRIGRTVNRETDERAQSVDCPTCGRGYELVTPATIEDLFPKQVADHSIIVGDWFCDRKLTILEKEG